MGANRRRNTTSYFAFQPSALNSSNETKTWEKQTHFFATELTVCFYGEAVDHPRESFEMIAKRVVPRGFGKAKTSATFKKRSPQNVLFRPLELGVGRTVKRKSKR
jgi:hypothetical protein